MSDSPVLEVTERHSFHPLCVGLQQTAKQQKECYLNFFHKAASIGAGSNAINAGR